MKEGVEKEEGTESGASLSALSPARGAIKPRKRLGFGEGSGHGKTCGKGHKGARSRSGFTQKPGFEGGQTPLHRRLPKIGFNSRKKTAGSNVYRAVSLEAALKCSAAGKITAVELVAGGLISSVSVSYKILGATKVGSALHIEAPAFSRSAREAIEGAGGKAVTPSKTVVTKSEA